MSTASMSTRTLARTLVHLRGWFLCALLASAAHGQVPNINQQGLAGSWFNPATSGQGLLLEAYPSSNQLVGTWFTFDTTAGDVTRQRWYSIAGTTANGAASSTITIFRNIGGNFDTVPVTTAEAVGTGTLSFSTCTQGNLAYSFSDGRTGNIPLTRLLSDSACVSSTSSPTERAEFGLSGSWFEPATSGQGFVIEINSNQALAFLGWFTYAANGSATGVSGQRWFTAPGRVHGVLAELGLTGTERLLSLLGFNHRPTNIALWSGQAGAPPHLFFSCVICGKGVSRTSTASPPLELHMNRRALLSCSLLLASVAVQAQEGALDPSFGILGSGRTAYGFDFGNDGPAGMIVDAQGRAYTVGLALNNGTWRATLAKLTAAGVLDTGFGGDGKVVSTDLEGSFLATDIAFDSIGQLLVAGARVFGDSVGGDRDFMVCRYNTAGTAINFAAPTNSHCRVLPFDLGGSNIDQARVLKTLPDGSMYLIGYAEGSADFLTARIVVVKLTSTGALDTTFSGDGKLMFTYPGGSSAAAYDAAVAADGTLYLSGYVGIGGSQAIMAVKITSNGLFDTGFGGDGFQAYQLDLGAVDYRNDVALAVALTNDGKLMLGGYADQALNQHAGFVLRVSASNAGFDGTFGNAGKLILGGNGFVKDLVVQQDNMTVYARSMELAGAYRYRVGRLTDLGHDTRFGTGGIIDISFGFADAYDRAEELVISNGRILVMGSVANAANYDFGLARLRGDAMFANGFE